MGMTHDEIMALEAGELDAAVAVHVMGWKQRAPFWVTKNMGMLRDFNWSPSTDLNHANEVCEKVYTDRLGGDFCRHLRRLVGCKIKGGYMATQCDMVMAPAPARCRAALMAVMGSN